MNKLTKENSARIFFALWPNEAERTALAIWQPALHKLCGGRSMRADTLHATLVFIGGLELHRLEALQQAAQEVKRESFDLAFSDVRYWGHNHIVYAAPDNVPPQLEQLVRNLEQCLTKHHLRFDKHPYKPHVTLLRNAQWRDELVSEMKEVIWQARSFVLVQSVPDNEGANYRVLARFSLQ